MAISDRRWTLDESTGELKDDAGNVIATLSSPYSGDKIKSAMLDHAAATYSSGNVEEALIILGLMAAENFDRV